MGTLTKDVLSNMVSEFRNCITGYDDYMFQDGYTSPLGLELIHLLEKYSNDGYVVLYYLMREYSLEAKKAYIIDEVLRILGRIEDKTTEYLRILILASFTYSDDIRVLDGAGLGAASIDNPIMLPFFQGKRPGCFWNLVEEQLEETLEKNEVVGITIKSVEIDGITLEIEENHDGGSANIRYKCPECKCESINVGGYVLGEGQDIIDRKIKTAAASVSKTAHCNADYHKWLDSRPT